MHITDITEVVVNSYDSRQPLMVWGPPGVGKSDGFKAAADVLNEKYMKMLPRGRHSPDTRAFGFIDLRLSLMEPVDLRGFGFPNQKTQRIDTYTPAFLPTSGRGIILADEIVEATHQMQGCVSQLLLDRRIGEYVLPEGWVCHGAGNEVGHKAASRGMPTHIAGRFIHLTAEVSVDAWVSWALKKGLDLSVIAFIKFRPALLHVFDPQAKGHAYASPRGWEKVSTQVKTFTGRKDLLLQMIKGTVSDGPGGEFFSFLDMYKSLPSVDNILLNPKTADLPENPGVRFVISNALATVATKDNLPRVVQYLDRLADAGHPEYSVSAVKKIAEKDNSALTKTRTFIEWASRHNHILN